MAPSTKFSRLKIGEWYEVKFLDHCIHQEEIILTCKVYGWLVSNEKDYITLSWWGVDHEDWKSELTELVNVVKSTIVSIKKVNQ